jgi:hypothetical protein
LNVYFQGAKFESFTRKLNRKKQCSWCHVKGIA